MLIFIVTLGRRTRRIPPHYFSGQALPSLGHGRRTDQHVAENYVHGHYGMSMSEEQFQQGFHRDGEKFQQLLRRTLIAPFKVIDLVVPVEEEEDYFLLGASGKLPKDLKYGSLHAPSIYDVKKYLTKKSSSNRDDEWVFRSSFRVIDFAQLDKRKWQKADVVLLFNPYVVVDASGPYEAVKAGCNVWPEGKGMLMTTFSENLMSNAASRVENERGNSRKASLLAKSSRYRSTLNQYREFRPLRTKKYKTFTSVSNRAKVVTANVERVPLVTSIPPAEYFEQPYASETERCIPFQSAQGIRQNERKMFRLRAYRIRRQESSCEKWCYLRASKHGSYRPVAPNGYHRRRLRGGGCGNAA